MMSSEEFMNMEANRRGLAEGERALASMQAVIDDAISSDDFARLVTVLPSLLPEIQSFRRRVMCLAAAIDRLERAAQFRD